MTSGSNEKPLIEVKPIGVIHSSLTSRTEAPKQGVEGAPDAWFELNPEYAEGLSGIAVGSEIMLITWLHLADRGILQSHPRSDRSKPLTGIFATRSPDRPNPICLHKVTMKEICGSRLRVGPLEALDGTPVIDLKSYCSLISSLLSDCG